MKLPLLTLIALLVLSKASADESIEFNRDVRPILSKYCFSCHGPDEKHREANLRLDVPDDVNREPVVTPGNPNISPLIERIYSEDKDTRMPPLSTNKELSAREKAMLRRWIAEGAKYQRHWSYERPVKAVIASGKNGVDALIEKRYSTLGVTRSPEADRRVLIRRLYVDLLGLPPKPDEVAEFVNDRSSDAYTNLVERILASPHYGERMAMGWLDLVRFADTIGYHSDNPRNVWPYRDWVIRSFNDNKPFDRFTVEQIAGDLLADADNETKVGSAFNRLLLTTEEGGAQAKDYEQRMLADRVRSIGLTWLGQTIGCAQCHDHKFDPITMRDFYSMGAFFADVKEPILGKRGEGMVIASDAEKEKLAHLESELTKAKEKYDAIQSDLEEAQEKWEANIKAFSIVLRELKDPTASKKAFQLASDASAALEIDPSNRSKAQKTAIREYYLEYGTDLFRAEREALERAQAERDEFDKTLVKCLVTESSSEKRTVRLLPRGNWMDESGEVMKPALPKYLVQNDADDRELTRLDLAHWIVSRENPLTARTFVNRLWKHFFGIGLSRVLDDLGAQGEPPSNVELLDWLACEFMDSGWDVKHIVRTIVHSQTYKQTSIATPEQIAADPTNRILNRQNAFRMEAELVRDAALSISGLIVPKLGGPSVKPYQPENYWENLNFPPRKYVADEGESQYRRGLYVWWQRTFLHPSMLAFDAPSREEGCAERGLSNIPQQALVLLNDPTYVEAARAFAARILTEKNGDPKQRLTWAWQQALQRDPTAEEKATMMKLLVERVRAYQNDLNATEELLEVGLVALPKGVKEHELAAWTHVARVLLNLHETITRQ